MRPDFPHFYRPVFPSLIVRLFLALIPGLLSSCFVFSSPQSARMLHRQQLDIGIESNATNVKQGARAYDSFGLGARAGYGISDRVSLYARYQWIKLANVRDVNYHYVSLEPKFGIVRDIMAAALPVGFFAGQDVSLTQSVQFHPTILFTIPISQKLEVNLAPEAVVFVPTFDYLLALNGGVGLSANLDQWAVRPQVSVSVNPETKAVVFSGSIGFSGIMALFGAGK
jgi:hypothetical protein